MTDKKKLLDDLKGTVREDEAIFSVEEGLKEDDLDAVSGGMEVAQCLCKCAADYGGNPTCGGGGGGGSAFEEQT